MAIYRTGYWQSTRKRKNSMFELLRYEFFINALWASVLAAITCGIIGTYIVSRRIVFISGGISHASFGFAYDCSHVALKL